MTDKPGEKAIEAAARAQCSLGGFDPDTIMANDGPLWRYYVPGVEAAINAYHAAMVEELEQIFDARQQEGTVL